MARIDYIRSSSPQFVPDSDIDHGTPTPPHRAPACDSNLVSETEEEVDELLEDAGPLDETDSEDSSYKYRSMSKSDSDSDSDCELAVSDAEIGDLDVEGLEAEDLEVEAEDPEVEMEHLEGSEEEHLEAEGVEVESVDSDFDMEGVEVVDSDTDDPVVKRYAIMRGRKRIIIECTASHRIKRPSRITEFRSWTALPKFPKDQIPHINVSTTVLSFDELPDNWTLSSVTLARHGSTHTPTPQARHAVDVAVSGKASGIPRRGTSSSISASIPYLMSYPQMVRNWSHLMKRYIGAWPIKVITQERLSRSGPGSNKSHGHQRGGKTQVCGYQLL